MKARTLVQVLAPIILLSKIFGMQPYIVRKKRLRVSLIRLIYTIACLSIYLWHVYLSLRRANNVGKMSSMMVKSFGWTLLIFVIVLTGRDVFSKILQASDKLAKVDMTLARFRQKDLLECNYQHRRYLLVLILINGVYNLISEIFVKLTGRHGAVDFFVNFTYPRIVISVVNVKFFLLMIIIKSRFKIINDVLKDKVGFVELVETHKTLRHITNTLNSAFSLYLLLLLTQSFLMTLVDLHSTLYMILFQSFVAKFQTIFITIKNCFIYCFDLCFLTTISSNLCSEVRSLKVSTQI